MGFERTYAILVTYPDQKQRSHGFPDPQKMHDALKIYFQSQRDGAIPEEAVIQSEVTEDSIAGTIYADLIKLPKDDVYESDDYEADFYDEIDDEGEQTLSTHAIMDLIDHVSRLNDFHNGGIRLDHFISTLRSYKNRYKEIGTFYVRHLERKLKRFKPTVFGTVTFEDGSSLYVINPFNSKQQEQAFNASIILWDGDKYRL